jgi:hypothetical protein
MGGAARLGAPAASVPRPAPPARRRTSASAPSPAAPRPAWPLTTAPPPRPRPASPSDGRCLARLLGRGWRLGLRTETGGWGWGGGWHALRGSRQTGPPGGGAPLPPPRANGQLPPRAPRGGCSHLVRIWMGGLPCAAHDAWNSPRMPEGAGGCRGGPCGQPARRERLLPAAAAAAPCANAAFPCPPPAAPPGGPSCRPSCPLPPPPHPRWGHRCPLCPWW